MRTLRIAVAVSSLALSAACVSPGGSLEQGYAPGAVEASPVRRAPATVRVTNNNWADMNVYLVRGTARFRLGTVSSMSTQIFRVPAGAMGGVGGLRLLADPIGSSNGFLTPAVHVSAGERVDFDIQNQLPISSVSVWGRS